ncbi:hypothetical protein A2U01_0050053 [Trifolium medium]|uniref:Uncharacterized protein n=1 Tax=Trifolium medium TaxID=97028 RepID=A0A392QWX5_9FABA|nr:hypothetical protein [Trifolium medium]
MSWYARLARPSETQREQIERFLSPSENQRGLSLSDVSGSLSEHSSIKMNTALAATLA